MLHVALYQPKIPPNTGNIARQCVGMGAYLHIIGPHELDLSQKAVKRAGLDYWPSLLLTEHATPEAFLDWLGGREPWVVTKFGETRYDRADYRDGDVLLFGNELKGFPKEWHERWPGHRISIPMPGTMKNGEHGNVRSYNLANTVGIVLAEAMRIACLYE